ncbi:hypothetical protein H0H81_009632 [Sphagnurus paluster]|uniref:Uncharacterized protein n=1 Tax=Sphagnurus paluster TaxID=117069 RepID=A0A9P7GME0_9AGAR|nr:hypothetical protein H0H81_009632 [Sphagnurus paluster]
MSSSSKTPHWKGQSRVQKLCHWCTKPQGTRSKPFQACGRCREAACNFNSKNKEKILGGDPTGANTVAAFKKWCRPHLHFQTSHSLTNHRIFRHGSHVPAFRQAAICALDLGSNPSKVDDGVLCIDVKLKPNHESLPTNQKYEPVAGCTLTMQETLQMIGTYSNPFPCPHGGASIIESAKSDSSFMKAKGGLGVVMVMLQAYGYVDIVKVVLPSASVVKAAQQADNWGDQWVR